MTNRPLIQKASGEYEPFNPEKLQSSLQRSGAGEKIAKEIASDILNWIEEGVSTKKIYGRAFRLLRKKRRSTAARYSLKKAIMELGPSGYPFEHFVGHLFEFLGYAVEVGQTVNGQCVTHEVDVVATKGKEQHLVECKYHNSQGKFSSVQVPLYIRSRVNDIMETRLKLPEFSGFTFYGWIVTNTRFTSDASDYGRCSGLNLISWDYPRGRSLKELTEKYNAFPVTALTHLTKAHKQHLLKKEIVLCRELARKLEILEALQLSEQKQKKVVAEINELCDGQ
ncbi:MAG: restriction endonuclease [Bacteroidota bacterium]